MGAAAAVAVDVMPIPHLQAIKSMPKADLLARVHAEPPCGVGMPPKNPHGANPRPNADTPHPVAIMRGAAPLTLHRRLDRRDVAARLRRRDDLRFTRGNRAERRLHGLDLVGRDDNRAVAIGMDEIAAL